MNEVTIVGAGFSGLTLAYYLQKLGLKPVIIEKQSHCGGLISSVRTDHGLVESAANALLADVPMEDLFSDLGVEFAVRLPARKKRYIYWTRPQQWPLSAMASIRALWGLVRFVLGFSSGRPRNGETIKSWATRVFGSEFEERLLSPALQGIYAGNPERLSAKLVVGSAMRPKTKKRLRGSVSPRNGMGDLLAALRERVIKNGAEIKTDQEYVIPKTLTGPTVICTSAWSAAQIVAGYDQSLADLLEQCESLPVVSTTAFFEHSKKDIQGFGCLFPQSQRFNSLGVLFNSCIFRERSHLRSETWIMGGFAQPKVFELTDDQILDLILRDRKKMVGLDERPLSFKVNRWPRALPHYTIDWEKALANLQVERPLYLHGNYLGAIGLSRICARSRKLAQEIRESYG